MTSKTPRFTVTVVLLALLGVPLTAAPPGPDRAPPSGPEIARRALVLRAVHSLRLHPRRGERSGRLLLKKLESDRRHLVRWLKRERLFGAATPWEQRVLETPVGQIDPADGTRAARQGDAMVVLLYSIGALDVMPRYDGAGGLTAASKILPNLLTPTAAFVQSARVRPRADLDSAQEIAALWHWRSYTKGLIDAKKFPTGKKLHRHAKAVATEMRRIGMEPKPIQNGAELFDELIRFSAQWAHKEGKIPAPIDGDYPVRGKAYRDIDDSRFRRIRVLAETRARTFNWLQGFGVDWDSTPIDI